MREAVMSAGMSGMPRETAAIEQSEATNGRTLHAVAPWSPERFADEQIRRLVRHLFAPDMHRGRQVVLTAAEPETRIDEICMRVGEALANETTADVAVVGGGAETTSEPDQSAVTGREDRTEYSPLRLIAGRVKHNLWLVPGNEGKEPRSTALLRTYLGELRREFEYSIVMGRCAGQSNEAAAMAQFSDGIVLVVSALRTRRAAASKIKQMLDEARVRLLGVVLSDREFPIPDRVYRRL